MGDVAGGTRIHDRAHRSAGERRQRGLAGRARAIGRLGIGNREHRNLAAEHDRRVEGRGDRIGTGGLLVAVALARGAPIDDIVLWATAARGRTHLRELRAFATLESEGLPPNRARGGSLERARSTAAPAGAEQLKVAGFLMSGETVGAFEALDLTELSIPEPTNRRALLLERDGLAVDRRLREHLEAEGLDVTVRPGLGYGAMMAEPQNALPPVATFELVQDWLDSSPLAPAAAATPAPARITERVPASSSTGRDRDPRDARVRPPQRTESCSGS